MSHCLYLLLKHKTLIKNIFFILSTIELAR